MGLCEREINFACANELQRWRNVSSLSRWLFFLNFLGSGILRSHYKTKHLPILMYIDDNDKDQAGHTDEMVLICICVVIVNQDKM